MHTLATSRTRESPLAPNSSCRDRWDDTQSVESAYAEFLARYALGDGGYGDNWVQGKVGIVPILLPNTKARKREIGAHDLHHIATGCNAIWHEGEIDIAAYELRSGGCGRFVMGWLIMLGFFFVGLLVRPRSVFQTFVAARGGKNLFGRRVGREVLAMTVAEFRAQLRVPRELRAATRRDYVLFSITTCFALLEALVILGTPFVLLALVVWLLVRA